MKKLLMILGVFFLWTSQLWSATYYIDPSCSTSGDGTTTICGAHGPFKTWAEVKWAAGNTYSQKGGTTAYETITVSASGTAGNAITINSYGTGKANLDGGIVLTPESWGTPDANGVYKQAGFGYGMLEDDVFLKWCPIAGCASGAGNYYYVWGSSSPNYYKPTSGTPANHVTKKMRPYGIQLGSNSYITITGFKLKHYTYGIVGTGLTAGQSNNYITVSGNEFSDMQFGIWINFNQATSSGIKITNNTFDYIMSSIEFQNQGDCKSSPGIHDSVEIANNTITHGAMIRGAGTSYYWDEVNTAGWDKEGIGFQNLSNSNIHHNSISGHIRGIVLFVCAGDEAFNNNFYANYINTDLECIMFYPRYDSSPAKSFYNNKAYYNLLVGGRGGYATTFYAGNVPTPVAAYNYIYNNTLYYPINGIFGTKTTDYYSIKNNIIYNATNYFIYLPSTTAPANMVYDNNLYKGYYAWNGWYVNGGSKTFTQWKALGTNYDAHSPTPADPLFENPTDGNYNLTSSSPAKWAGVNVGLKTDYANRTVHNPPSIGAYEYIVDYSVIAPKNLQVNNLQ